LFDLKILEFALQSQVDLGFRRRFLGHGCGVTEAE
jgi:hypothetical protein